MLKKLTLGTKLWGFTALLLLTVLIVAGTSIGSIKSILSSSQQYSKAAEDNAFIVLKEVDHLKWIGMVQDLFVENAKTLEVELDHTKCGLGKFLHGEGARHLSESDPTLAVLINEIKVPHRQLHESGNQIKGTWRQQHEGLSDLLKDRLDDHRKWASKVSEIIISQNPGIQVEMDHTQCGFGKFLESDTLKQYENDFPVLKEAMDAVKGPHQRLHASAKKIKSLAAGGDFDTAGKTYQTVTLAELESVERHFKEIIDLEMGITHSQTAANKIFHQKTLPALSETQAKMKRLRDQLASVQSTAKSSMTSTGAKSKWSAFIITIVTFVSGGVLSFFITRSITKPVNRIIAGLNAGADQVAAASGQVSSSSQQLAEGASEQAASLEETSSSLEEMSSMTKQNAAHASQADNLMKDVNLVVTTANDSMHKLTASMEDISAASEETAKIIKTIDEIAFQTNLLALNAAVEAARAGDAGAGFAVVADEVRNLAMRAAEAAKNTATLLEGTSKKVNDGSVLVTQTNDAFSKVAESASQVGDLVGQISAACSEQAGGIDQVNRAVIEMDKVIQQNAGNAEENASASEEMNAQAEQMKLFVAELVAMVRKDSNGDGNRPKQNLQKNASRHHLSYSAPETPPALPPKNYQETPQQIISFNEGSFKDF